MLVFVSCNSPFLSIPSYCRELASQSIIVSTIAPNIVATIALVITYKRRTCPFMRRIYREFRLPSLMDLDYRAGASVGLCEVDRGG